jgi:hypothetical protein
MSRWLKRLEELASPSLSLSPPVQNVQNAQKPASTRAITVITAGSEQIEQIEHGREETGNRATGWRERYDKWLAFERRMARRREPHASAAQVERMAWNAVAGEWHRQNGERAPEGICAGCCQPLAGVDVLLLPHGEHAHADADYACIAAYGRRWRWAAAVALAQYGIPAPPRDAEDEAVLEAGAA